jgi:bidirectional [NiFe] hydrogenase diaphorase subunit
MEGTSGFQKSSHCCTIQRYKDGPLSRAVTHTSFEYQAGMPGVFAMTLQLAKPAPPSDDKRWKMVEVTMRRSGYASHALIETLHRVQGLFGYLDEPAMQFVAESLGLPLSKVYGVATFYHLFSLKPQGKHTCVVCQGTACYIKGAKSIVEAVRNMAGIKPGETTEDKKVSLVVAHCIGACGLAPATVLDGEVMRKATPDGVAARVQEWLNDAG